ncbi:MAG TPA: hypothetical protein VNX27_02765 [Chthoniobacterales bacterium]|nr:hypothetical protein [Chthoniobacterales bacterium]
MTRALTVTLMLVAAVAMSAVAGEEITQSRAHQIAAYYYGRYFPREGCGGTGLPELRGDYWESIVRLGYAGKPSGIIRIHRLTGKVSYSGPYFLKPPTSANSLERWAKRLDERTR